MKIKYDVTSHVGRVRTNNEDMALVFGSLIRDDAQRSMVPMKSRPRFSALIADGMGGYGGGEIASEMTLQSFDGFLLGLPDSLDQEQLVMDVKNWFAANNSHVMSYAATSPGLTNMGTTLTGIFTYGPYDLMVNAGDSRVYRWRFDTLRQLSVDHSERQRCGGDPSIPSNLIYNAVGIPEAFVDVTVLNDEAPIVDGDVYVICSDGLCDMIGDSEIAEVLRRGGGSRELVDAALEAGGRDNCTVIVLQVSIPADYDAAQAYAEAIRSKEEEDKPAEPEVTPPPVPEATIGPKPEPEVKPAPAPESEPAVPPIDPAGFEIDDNPGPTPPPLPESAVTEETITTEELPLTEGDPSQPVAPESRARTAGKLLKEAISVFFGKNK